MTPETQVKWFFKKILSGKVLVILEDVRRFVDTPQERVHPAARASDVIEINVNDTDTEEVPVAQDFCSLLENRELILVGDPAVALHRVHRVVFHNFNETGAQLREGDPAQRLPFNGVPDTVLLCRLKCEGGPREGDGEARPLAKIFFEFLK